MATEVTVPVLGESITEATLGEWLKQPGDKVAVDEPIASLETDKVSVEVGAPAAGVWSTAACAQPLAIEVLAGADRLIANTGWSPRAGSAQALRLTPAGSCANVADASAGEPLRGARARILGRQAS